MLKPSLFPLIFLFILFLCSTGVQAASSYANDFVDPDRIVAGNFASTSTGAQGTTEAWANELSAYGPWCEFLPFSLVLDTERLVSSSCHEQVCYAR